MWGKKQEPKQLPDEVIAVKQRAEEKIRKAVVEMINDLPPDLPLGLGEIKVGTSGGDGTFLVCCVIHLEMG